VKKFIVFISLILTLALSFGCCVTGIHGAQQQVAQQQQKKFIENIRGSTVALVRDNMFGKKSIMCSGTWISKYVILTARHCVENDDESVTAGKIVEFYTHKLGDPPFGMIQQDRNVLKAIIVAFAIDTDIALISSIDDVEHNIAPLYNGEVPIGTSIHTIGHPHGMEYSYITGRVSATRHSFVFGIEQRVLHITILGYNGNSGCGAFDDNGRLIGMSIFSNTRVPGMKFFLHATEIVDFVKEQGVPATYK
jgi:S1-C subfamily serine protease